MAGGVLNNEELVFAIARVRLWDDSFAGPAERFVANPTTDCGPASAGTLELWENAMTCWESPPAERPAIFVPVGSCTATGAILSAGSLFPNPP